MMRISSLLLCVCAAWTLANAQRQTLAKQGKYKGDVCKEENGVVWTCKKFAECPVALKGFKETRRRPDVCSYGGTPDSLLVCCDPGTRPSTAGSKAKEMCKFYSKYVYVNKTGGFFNDVIPEDTCAASEPLIAFGKEADPREFPHMALIGFTEDNGSLRWACGGSLISERFVLSAAHCGEFVVRSSGTQRTVPAEWARLGEYNKDSNQDNNEGKAHPEDYKIIQVITHSDYTPPSLYNDITLLKLKENVRFNEFVRPACLQTDHDYPKTYVIASGWGKTDITVQYDSNIGSSTLMKVNLTVLPRQDCFNHYQDSIGWIRLNDGIRDESMLCAGDTSGGNKDVCSGDSGGPLQHRLKDPYCMYRVIGLVSFGPTDCGKGGAPSVFTRVSHFIPWIERTVWP